VSSPTIVTRLRTLTLAGLAVIASSVGCNALEDLEGDDLDEPVIAAVIDCSSGQVCPLCQTCKSGTCQNVGAGTDPRNDCHGGSTSCLTGQCDGHGTCTKKPDGTTCGPSLTCRVGACPDPAAEIELSASELIYSAVRGKKSVERTLTIRNLGTAALTVTSAKASGSGFSQVAPPTMPQTIAPGAQLTLRTVFGPSTTATLGLNKGTLKITSSDLNEGSLTVNLYGLATKGEQGGNEPPLSQVVATLGYAINVGGTALELGTGAAPIGDEVPAPQFRRASAGPVTLKPVARYSPDEPIPYGLYTTPNGPAGAPVFQDLGVINLGQMQTLLPTVQPGAILSFDPGDGRFGLFARSKIHTTFTEDARDAGNDTKHGVRSYPLKDRAGKPVANTFLVGFEEAKNGDYNDYVFVLGNVVPAP
jgi:hypothetical protein